MGEKDKSNFKYSYRNPVADFAKHINNSKLPFKDLDNLHSGNNLDNLDKP